MRPLLHLPVTPALLKVCEQIDAYIATHTVTAARQASAGDWLDFHREHPLHGQVAQLCADSDHDNATWSELLDEVRRLAALSPKRKARPRRKLEWSAQHAIVRTFELAAWLAREGALALGASVAHLAFSLEGEVFDRDEWIELLHDAGVDGATVARELLLIDRLTTGRFVRQNHYGTRIGPGSRLRRFDSREGARGALVVPGERVVHVARLGAAG